MHSWRQIKTLKNATASARFFHFVENETQQSAYMYVENL